MKSTGIIAASLTLIFIPLLCRGVAFANDPALARAIADLRASDTEWRQERDLFREKREAKAIDRVEAEEYAEFVASLQRQKLENCEEVRKLGGNTALEGTDCIILTARKSMPIQETVPSEPPPTEMEEASSLDDQLKALEAELDKELAKAERRVRETTAKRVAQLPERQNADAGGAANSQSRENRELRQAGFSEQKFSDANQKPSNNAEVIQRKTGLRDANNQRPENRSGDTDQGDTINRGSGGGAEKRYKSVKADNSPGESGNDDDIVLRQIREAAEKETDPVLKGKLWEEYRKIKKARN
nr:hypothetical protein [uncultured bacterium]